jgi:hypothetical protein
MFMIRSYSLLTTLRVGIVALATTLLVRATTVVPPQFETLVNESDSIVHVVAKNVTAEKRTTARGSKIVTRVEFETLDVVAGTAPASTFTLEFLGGEVDGQRMTVEGMPRFAVGDEDILFVSGSGHSICPLYAMMHGRYHVENNATAGRKIVTRSDGTPLQNTAQVASALSEGRATRSAAAATALAPIDFINQIRATVRPDAPISRGK